MSKNVEQLCVDTIRTLSIDAVQKANSGHPGMPMGMADAAFVLWSKFLKHNPNNPEWFNRDRFVLSAGHGSMLIYSLLHLHGYDVSLDELKNFRQLGSITPGHPEYGLTPGVETTTGPLGQGFATGVGMAIAEAHLAERFNQPEHILVDHFVYGIVSDGDLMEGVSHEAASLAGHLKLGKIVYLYDDNSITIDGGTDRSFSDNTLKRFKSYGWHVQEIDGHNRDAVESAIQEGKRIKDQPSIIACKTKIGYGSPSKEGTSGSHGAPLGEEEIKATKEAYGWNYDEPFTVPQEVKDHYSQFTRFGNEWEQEWKQAQEVYESVHPEAFEEFSQCLNFTMPEEGLEAILPVFEEDAKGVATRKSSGKVLNALGTKLPFLVGGSADLHASNNTLMTDFAQFEAQNYAGRNLYYGIREHAMVAALNGMVLHGGIKPYGGTFLVFSDYCKPSIRIAALSHIAPVMVFTHDSIGLGEDGPTHQPIEHLAALRAIPNSIVLRPADANEVAYAWKVAIETKNSPVSLILTRQNIPTFARNEDNPASLVEKGAYILSKESGESPDVILIGTGSEVHLCMDAQAQLKEQNIDARVVSMPSWELFEKQDKEYKESVFPKDVTARISVEAGSTMGWQKWIGDNGIAIGIDHFGGSAPYQELMNEFGFTVENVVESAKKLV